MELLHQGDVCKAGIAYKSAFSRIKQLPASMGKTVFAVKCGSRSGRFWVCMVSSSVKLPFKQFNDLIDCSARVFDDLELQFLLGWLYPGL